MSHSGQFAAFPTEMTDVEGVVKGPKEERAISNKRELIKVPQLDRILGFDHFNLIL